MATGKGERRTGEIHVVVNDDAADLPDGRRRYVTWVGITFRFPNEYYSVRLCCPPTDSKAEFERQSAEASALAEQIRSTNSEVAFGGPY